MSKFVLVEALTQYRIRYVVEVPDDHMEREYPCPAITWAEDTVTMNEAQEFSQKWLGETIIGSRELTKEQVLQMCDEDNEYCKSWSDEHKLGVFVTDIEKDESDES